MKKVFIIIAVFMTMIFSAFAKERCFFERHDQWGGRIYLSEIENDSEDFCSFMFTLETGSEEENYTQYIVVLCCYPEDKNELRHSLLKKAESFTYAGTGLGLLTCRVADLQWDIVRNGYYFLDQPKQADYWNGIRHKILFGITREDYEELNK